MNHVTACLTLFGISTIWASSFPVLRSTLGELAPFTLLFWRFFLSFLCLSPWLIKALVEGAPLGAHYLKKTLAPWHGLILWIFLGGAVMMQTVGTALTSASRAGFINTFSVVLAPIFMFILVKIAPPHLVSRLHIPRISGFLVGGMALALGGLLLIVLPGTGGGGAEGTALGNALLTSCTLGLAAHMLVIQLVPPGTATLALCAQQFGWVSLLCLGAAVVVGQPIVVPLPWLAIGYLSVVTTAFANAIQVAVQPKVSTIEASAIYALQPASSAVLAWLFLGENPRFTTLVGGGVLVVGILVMQVFPALYQRILDSQNKEAVDGSSAKGKGV